MAKVAVYNMEGKEVGSMDLNDAVFGVEVNEHLVHMAVPKYAAVVENHGDRKEQGMQDRVLSELHSGKAAELYSHRFQETTLSN